MTPADVLTLTSKGFGVTVEAIVGRGRTLYVCRARASAARSLRDLGLSLVEVGDLLGGRDHSTVLSMLRQVAEVPPRPGRV